MPPAAAAPIDKSTDAEIPAFGVAGHVLDFDDTYAEGLVHVSSIVGPIALILGSEMGLGVDEVMPAYSRGFETR